MYHHSQLKGGLNADYNSDPINAASSLIFLAHERKVSPRQLQSSLPVSSKTLTIGRAGRNLLDSKLSCMHPVHASETCMFITFLLPSTESVGPRMMVGIKSVMYGGKLTPPPHK